SASASARLKLQLMRFLHNPGFQTAADAVKTPNLSHQLQSGTRNAEAMVLELILGKGEAPSAYCRRWGFDFHTAGDVRGLVDANDFQDSSPRHRDQRTFSRVPAETVPHVY